VSENKIKFIKAFDRSIGSIVCQVLGLFAARSKKNLRTSIPETDLKNIKKILVIRPGGIGDAILFYPFLHHLKRKFPQSKLHILVEKRNHSVLDANSIADRIYIYDRFLTADLIKVLLSHYDLVIDTEQYHNLSAVVTFLTGAKYRCGFDTGPRGQLFTHRVPYNQQIYEVYSFLNLYSFLTGEEPTFDKNVSFYPVEEQFLAWAKEQLKKFDSKRIAILCSGATAPERRWGPKKYAELAGWMISKDFNVVLIGAPGEKEDSLEIEQGMSPKRFLNLVGKTSIPQAAAIVSLADIYVSSDTGILHVAYGVGTPTVHLFGPGILEKWAPVGERYIAITKNLPCSPCTGYGYTPDCPYDSKCVHMISVEDIKEAVSKILSMEK
jgi:lipopolysaccharide heptosyltransferase II